MKQKRNYIANFILPRFSPQPLSAKQPPMTTPFSFVPPFIAPFFYLASPLVGGQRRPIKARSSLGRSSSTLR